MAHIPFAFSVHHFVTSVGSYAGFASIIGLAILVLLYFAQARETSTLRDRADEAEQRAGQLEARLAQASRASAGRPAAVVQRPLPAARPLVNPVAAGASIAPHTPAAGQPAAAMAASAGAPAAQAAMPAAAATPAAPAGVGAPALSAATRLIPAPVAGQQLAPAASSAPTAPPATASPPPATVAGGAAFGAAGSNGPGAGTNGTSEEFAVALADPAPVAASAPLEPAPLEPAPLGPPPEPLPRVQLRPGGAAQTRPAAPSLRRPAPPRSPSRVGRGLALLLTALGVVAVVIVLVIVTSGGGGARKTASTGGTRTTNAPSAGHRVKAKPFNTSAVTVAVLNGTATSGAAARLSGQLGGFGYKQGPTTNAANQTQTSTVVMYLAGHRNDAVAVARSLKLRSSSVQAIDSQTQAIACPSATSCAVDVVVTVGQDLAG